MLCLTGEQKEQFLILTCSGILTGSGVVTLHGQWYLSFSFTRSWNTDAFEILEWLSSPSVHSSPLFFKDATHCGAEQRVTEKFSAGVDAPWSQLYCIQRRTDDIKSLSQRWSHSTYCTAQHSLSSFLPAFSCIALHSPLKAAAVATWRGNLPLFFLFHWEQHHHSKMNCRSS